MIRKCETGLGVFADKDYERGEVIETCWLREIDPCSFVDCFGEGRHIADFLFFLGGAYYIVTGDASLYNHSEKANARYAMFVEQLVFSANTAIAEGDEITIDYDYEQWICPEWYAKLKGWAD